MATPWIDSGCGGPKARFNDDGYIEIEGQGTPRKALNPRVLKYANLIQKYGLMHDVPPALIAGVINLESSGDANVVSFDNGVGLMQLTDPSLKGPYTNDQLKDPELNISIGVRFLRQLLDRQKGNWIRAAVSYNAGGAYCGSPCFRRSTPCDKTSSCAVRCIPNQWNLIAYCWSPCECAAKGAPCVASGDVSKTRDYVTDVIAWTNDAVANGLAFKPVAPTPPGCPDGWTGIYPDCVEPSPQPIEQAPPLIGFGGVLAFLAAGGLVYWGLGKAIERKTRTQLSG